MADLQSVTAFAPASVGNASVGFDTLGFALESPGDWVRIESSDEPGVQMRQARFQEELAADDYMDKALPLDAQSNVAGFAALRMWEACDPDQRPAGLKVDLLKGMGIGTGMGSSAASAAAAVKAASEILRRDFSESELIRFGLEAEALASGGIHGDNLIPSLIGGFVGIRSHEPLDYFSLPVPQELTCCLLHPRVRVLTSEAREALPVQIPLSSGISQWANVGSLVAGLYESDYERIGRSLKDHVAAPVRSAFIPGYELLEKIAVEAGALGFGISGSGPSVFALCRGEESCSAIAEAWTEAYPVQEVDFRIYKSRVASKGARITEMGKL